MKGSTHCFVYADKLDDGRWVAAIIDEGGGIISLSLPKESEDEAISEAKSFSLIDVSYKFRSEMSFLVREVGKKVVEFVNSCIKGVEPKITLKLRTELLTKFMKEVLMVVNSIPRGFVTCYGCVAEVLGKPNASRAVGRVLAMNPWPIVIPCHRVVKRDLTLGGYRGGLDMKRELLKAEGVAITLAGRVLPTHFLETKKLRELSRRSEKSF